MIRRYLVVSMCSFVMQSNIFSLLFVLIHGNQVGDIILIVLKWNNGDIYLQVEKEKISNY